MKIKVLGSAAGGGLPQWNCGCRNCTDARSGSPSVRPRTQSSIAVSCDGESWVVFNASPDIRSQIESFPALQPRGSLRRSGVAAVVLTDAEIDHTSGLMFLREGGELALHSTAFVRDALIGNGLLGTLAAYLQVDWTELRVGSAVDVRGNQGTDLGLTVEAFEVDGHPPLYYKPDGSGPQSRRGHTVGVKVRGRGSDAALVYVPGSGGADPALLGRIGSRDVLLWDGTFWTDDELPELGISSRRARDMGHLPIWGYGGSLELLRSLPVARRVFIHINNTNPILREGSPQRQMVESAGWEVAYDGMELEI